MTDNKRGKKVRKSAFSYFPLKQITITSLAAMFLCCFSYLVAVYEVEDQVYVSVHRLVLGQLRLHSVEPVDQSLQGVRELSGEQQRLLQLVLPARERRNQSTAAGWGLGVMGVMGVAPHLPLDRLAAHSVPSVPQLAQHVIQLLLVVLEAGLVFQRPPCSTGGVVHRVLAAQSLLELLSITRRQHIELFFCFS